MIVDLGLKPIDNKHQLYKRKGALFVLFGFFYINRNLSAHYYQKMHTLIRVIHQNIEKSKRKEKVGEILIILKRKCYYHL